MMFVDGQEFGHALFIDISQLNPLFQTRLNLLGEILNTENPRVGGSTPSPATIKFKNLGLPQW
jgi:hypothetical protein